MGISDLYFLDPQWLFNALASIISSRLRTSPPLALLTTDELPSVLADAGIPLHIYNSFLSMMEAFDIIVALDMEKGTYLLPTLLPAAPPSHYPHYDLSDTDETLTQYIQFDYLPNGFFSRLLARVLIYLRQISGQLLTVSPAHSQEVGGAEQEGLYGRVVAKGSPSLASSSHGCRLSRGYLRQEDNLDAAQDEGQVKRKIRAISLNLSENPTRHRSMTEKLVSLSQPFLQKSTQTATSTLISLQDPKGSLSRIDPFFSYIFWRSGLFVEFPSGTKFWLEASASAVVIVVSGPLVSRVKVLSFVMSCADALLVEVYRGLEAGHYSPCPSCLRKYWRERGEEEKAAFTDSLGISLPSNSVSILPSGIVTYSPSSPTDSINSSNSFQSFSGKLTLSPLATEVDRRTEARRMLLDGEVTLFPLSSAVLQSTKSHAFACDRCSETQPLVSVSPHVLLVDFSDRLLLDSALLCFNEEEANELGAGSFSKVVF